jgi:hypothetical protein
MIISEKNPIISYSFNQVCGIHDSPIDISGNGYNLQRPPYMGGLSSPEWSEKYGVKGPGYRFYGNKAQSQCFYRDGIERLLQNPIGTISLWIQPLGIGNKNQCILSVSNGFVPLKTEFMLEADYSADCFKASIVKDGVVLWSISAPGWPLGASVGLWTHLCIVQDGIRPAMFINGDKTGIILKSKNKASNWFSSLLDSKSPPSKLCIGATPRNYAPFMSLGLFALLDEITIWDLILSEQDIKDLYESNEPPLTDY